jgi:serine/threonine protein kinase
MSINNKKFGQLVHQERIGEWRIQWKNDGFDYQSLLNSFLAGDIPGQRLATETSLRTVHKLEYAGRLFVIKHDKEIDQRLEKKIWFFLAGTMYSRLIWLTAKAIRKGCPVLQDVYLVSERMSGRFCQEAYIIAEYVPGQSFLKESNEPGQPIIFLRPGDNLILIAEALKILHNYGLASNDTKISNFILTAIKRIKIIDLTTNTPILLAKVNDVLQMKKNYDTDVPVTSWTVKILTTIMSWHWRLKHRIRVWRKRLPAQKPSHIWEDLPSASTTTLDVLPSKPNQDEEVEESSSIHNE